MSVKVGELTVDELKIIIQEMIDEKMQELVSDPDAGLSVRENIIRTLKENKAQNKPRIPMSTVMKKYGINAK